MKKRIPTYDHVQALARNHQYLKDLGKVSVFTGLKRIEAEDNLCAKYQLHLVITPEFARQYTREQIEGQMIFFDDPVVSVKPRGNENAMIKVKGKGIPPGTMKIDEAGYVLRERRFLTVEIDLSKKIEDIKTKIQQLVKSYRKYLKLDQAHDKGTVLDPWDIYDKKRAGMNLLKIAKQISGETGNPSYDPELKVVYDQVYNAYSKAMTLVKNVSSK